MKVKNFNDYLKTRLNESEIAEIEAQAEREFQALKALQQGVAQAINGYMKKENIGFNDMVRKLDISPSKLSKIQKGEANLTLASIAHIAALLKQKPIVNFKDDEKENDFQIYESKYPTNNSFWETETTIKHDKNFIKYKQDRIYSEFREYIDDIYQIYIQYCPDSFNKFHNEKVLNFEGCMWEMYIFHLLYKNNFRMEKTGDGKPDLCLVLKDELRVWIECISVKKGKEGNTHTIVDRSATLPNEEENNYGVYFTEPQLAQHENDYLLLISSGISDKSKKFKNYINALKIKNDYTIIAVNLSELGSDLKSFEYHTNISSIMKVLFINQIENDSNIYSGTDILNSQNNIMKNTTNIQLGLFSDNNYSHISAVIYHNDEMFLRVMNHTNLPKIVYNPNALNKLPPDLFKNIFFQKYPK